MQELLQEVINAREIAMDINFRAALDFVRDAIEQDFLEKEKEVMYPINCKCNYILTSEQGCRVIKCLECGDVKPI